MFGHRIRPGIAVVAIAHAARATCLARPARADASPVDTLVLLVFDGLAPAMVESTATPALDRMRREGAASHALEPAFPTISLINGFTLSTGCWPEHHGIVTNKFLDPELGLYDHSRDADWLRGCEGLHEVAERQGVRTAALGWYGGLSGTRGSLASITSGERSDDEYPEDSERLRQVIDLLQPGAEDPPRLLLAYFRGPDGTAHSHGVDADETRARVAEADTAVGAVMEALEALAASGARGRATLLVTTDHGMVPASRMVNIHRILRRHDIRARAVSTGSTSFLYFEDAEAVDAAEAKLSSHPELELIRPERPPEWFHLGAGPRVGDLIVSVRPPYLIEDPEIWPRWLRWLARVGPDFLPGGAFLAATHGYPPGTPGVDGVLYAWGVGVARGRDVGRVRMVDVHPTVARLLGIEPGVPVDGEVARELLAPATR